MKKFYVSLICTGFCLFICLINGKFYNLCEQKECFDSSPRAKNYNFNTSAYILVRGMNFYLHNETYVGY